MPQYILRGKRPVEVDDMLTWGRWFESADRHVGETQISKYVKVSTVFLGIDHGFDEDVPILFETMIFGGEHDDYTERYTTWEDAEVGHAKAVKLCQ